VLDRPKRKKVNNDSANREAQWHYLLWTREKTEWIPECKLMSVLDYEKGTESVLKALSSFKHSSIIQT
jgi:hypothetical protein